MECDAKVFETDFDMGPSRKKSLKLVLICVYCPLITCCYNDWEISFYCLISSCSSGFLLLIIEHNMIVLTKPETWKLLLNCQNYAVIMLLLMFIANKMMLTKTSLYRRASSFHFPGFFLFLAALWLLRLLQRTVSFFSLCYYIVFAP